MRYNILFLILFVPKLIMACPGCGQALDATLGRGFNISIYFLMATPFMVFFTIAGVIILHSKKALKQK